MEIIAEQINYVDNMRFTHKDDQLCFDKIVNIRSFWYFPGVGWWGKIENKDHLSPAKAETRAELGNKRKSYGLHIVSH